MIQAGAVTAVLDSCVLYPPGLRNLLMWLAVEETYIPKWTADTHEEWIRNVLAADAKKTSPPKLDRANLERTRDLMDRNVRESLVTGYERWIPGLNLPDFNDRHVLAAAIESRSEIIVTYNNRHFPKTELSQYGVDAVKPDAFLSSVFDQ